VEVVVHHSVEKLVEQLVPLTHQGSLVRIVWVEASGRFWMLHEELAVDLGHEKLA
jgi:hypothetical protein